MKYSFLPTPPIDTLNDHTGLFIISLMIITFLALCVFNYDGWRLRPAFVISLIVFCVSAVISYNTGSIKTYKNESVQGVFIEFVAEGYNEARTSGKTTHRVDVHNTYVVYRVDGRNVLFAATRGIEYPQIATLYRN